MDRVIGVVRDVLAVVGYFTLFAAASIYLTFK